MTINQTRVVRLMDEFTRAYVECALWTSHDDDGETLDGAYDVYDVDLDSLREMVDDCQAFQSDNGISGAAAGQDFWLTRNRHGAGFWDGDYPPADGRRLTEAAHVYGSCALYIGDDGKLYTMGG
jgi:hypothetical protein